MIGQKLQTHPADKASETRFLSHRSECRISRDERLHRTPFGNTQFESGERLLSRSGKSKLPRALVGIRFCAGGLKLNQTRMASLGENAAVSEMRD